VRTILEDSTGVVIKEMIVETERGIAETEGTNGRGPEIMRGERIANVTKEKDQSLETHHWRESL
jgi:hypothetical protein